MPLDDDPPDADQQRREALLTLVKRTLAERGLAAGPRGKPLFRVVEVLRDPRGRLSTQGQIWHTDLDHVRRFGHALGANTTADRVQITDVKGQVLEQIEARSASAAPAGWAGWRDRPLPPLPAQARRSQPPPALRPPPPAASATAPPPVQASAAPAPRPALPPRDIPVVEQLDFDPEATATLSPAPPP